MKTTIIIIILLSAVFCNRQTTMPYAQGQATGSSSSQSEGANLQTTEDTTSIATKNNRFALVLYKTVRNETDNMIISPFSISSALAMTYAGAAGNTAKQMSEVLHFSKDQKTFHPEYGQYIRSVKENKGTGNIELNIANSLWTQKDFSFKKDFVSLTEKQYDAGVMSVDFSKENEKTRLAINRWVEERTKQKIKDLLQSGDLSQSTVLVLANAVYFYGAWQKAFDAKKTFDADFFTTPTTPVTASFMKQKGDFLYAENDQLYAVSLPYSENRFSMILFVPKQQEGLSGVLKNFDSPAYEQLIYSLHKATVEIIIPRFTFSSRFDLEQTLAALGMPDAFSPKADFSGMTGKKELNIDKVIHQAFIEVNEQGTEAAASTAVVMRKTSMSNDPVVRADHPFFFVICENTHGGILFAGQVMNPGQMRK